MNERIRNILTLLVKKPEIKMAELTKELGLTRRQINYAINQFNSELITQKMPSIQRNHTGDFNIPLEVLQMISTQQTQARQLNLIPSDNERIALIIMFIVTNNYVSIDHLSDYLSIGKTTVTEDLKKAEQLIEKYYLTLKYDRVNGYHIEKSEHRIMQLLSDLVKRYPIIKREEQLEQLSNRISREEVIHLIHNMEQLLHLSYSDESLEYLKTVLPLLLARGVVKSELGVDGFFEGEVRDTPEYRFLNVLIKETEWKLSESYLEWITLLFLISNIFEKKTTQEFDSDRQLKELIREMVSNFERQTFTTIEDRENFERRILNHLRPACFRIKYNLSLGVYSLDSLIQDSNHAILSDLMKELIVPTENWLRRAFPNDELELLSYYFGFQLSNQHVVKKQKPRAVVVCTNGVMVSKVIRESLEKLFSELHFLSSFSVRDFYQFEVDYDLVFTTIPLETELPQFIIDPIMTYKEQISLRYRVLNELGINEVDQSVDRLMGIIQRYSEVSNSKELKEELQYFLLQEKQDSPLENTKVLPSLTYYLKPNYITVIDEEISWEEAIILACKPLIDNQVVNEAFITDCLQQIQQPNYAGFFGEKTCIPHTTAEHGIQREGISLLISQKKIDFPNRKGIQLIFPLSFLDLTKHLKAINQIADISTNQEVLHELLTKQETTSIYQLIRQFT
ncbi:PTS sugar transporter subunit IIA [Enterococcus florum]|uniref:Ascorbate-specific PTS system EIIA component n=1 Tax=Enterococcus florum TaxID=2480627 RepID=A0A4P5P9F8_9ENTE|nr:PTS sugar transporter subunit IIA [Enterococcus florum]GCF94715.1 PTS sugar transporter subunit IIA [Enterococcus florum]